MPNFSADTIKILSNQDVIESRPQNGGGGEVAIYGDLEDELFKWFCFS
jgi:hypothetical protein